MTMVWVKYIQFSVGAMAWYYLNDSPLPQLIIVISLHLYICNRPCGDRTPGRSLQSPTPKPLGHKGTWTTQSSTLGWFVTSLPPFWNPSPLARDTFNQVGELPLRRTRVTAATSVTGRAGIEPRVAHSRVQRLNHWAIEVPERPSRLRLAGSLHIYHYLLIMLQAIKGFSSL